MQVWFNMDKKKRRKTLEKRKLFRQKQQHPSSLSFSSPLSGPQKQTKPAYHPVSEKMKRKNKRRGISMQMQKTVDESDGMMMRGIMM